MSQSSAGRLADKVAIVTGAGARSTELPTCGQATAVLFAQQGAHVVVVDKSKDGATFTADQIALGGVRPLAVIADVTKSDDCSRVVDEALEAHGRIDILINNVGDHQLGSVVTLSEEEWDYMQSVNLKSIFWMAKYVLPHMIRAGKGSIVNLSSTAGARGAGGAAHAAAKGGVDSLTRDLAVTHGHHGIRVNCVSPGHLYTPMGADNVVANLVAGDGADEMREYRRSATPLGIEGTAWDAAHAVLFLASDEARYITGAILPVSAGIEATTVTMQRFADEVGRRALEAVTSRAGVPETDR